MWKIWLFIILPSALPFVVGLIMTLLGFNLIYKSKFSETHILSIIKPNFKFAGPLIMIIGVWAILQGIHKGAEATRPDVQGMVNEIIKVEKPPKKLDETVFLWDIRAEDETVVYDLELLFDVQTEEDLYTVHENLEKILIREACQDEDVLSLLKDGVLVSYEYKTKNGMRIPEILIDLSLCYK